MSRTALDLKSGLSTDAARDRDVIVLGQTKIEMKATLHPLDRVVQLIGPYLGLDVSCGPPHQHRSENLLHTAIFQLLGFLLKVFLQSLDLLQNLLLDYVP